MLLDTLKRLECSLHGSRRKDRKWLEQILHEGFNEITRSGVLVDRAQTIEALSGEDSVPAILSSDFRLISVRDNFAILHYRTVNSDGSRPSLRSSCWEISANGQWKLVFHQGTAAAESV
ncbi:nuclear transport factor 2 family protein [Atlantibacter hermannii]|nr:DUF4440 domain-containing protein [Atlantibacter hermannii]MBW9431770.1 DUF4440 domain-containing protein [Atlantibacter hermannii]MCQ4967577.1 DUF4440 domain-containing protein [Enterobacteriaceae bacterium DFI.7.85]